MKNYRALSEIGVQIASDWTKMSPHAKPYADAMKELNSINDMYYADSARSAVLYFLSNASTWRGEVAKAIKTELKCMLDGKIAPLRPMKVNLND